ncbi:ferrous iron transporter B [Phascolomyces articulosus]|uniref:Ferrous iron transporter B n=1 Tax=Phascolomyces articulosus TaxID=60185 RepID=A0AAD5KZN3_9FUNG|nr:ferrous iron transporter B [Phascolomyces articulosus]
MSSTAANQARQRRIAVLGARAVGKSSLVIQFCENHFVDSYYPTIENTFTKTIKYRGHEYVVEIMDTAGQDEYSILSSHHASSVHGYVLVYSIASRSSLDMIKVIRDKILDFTGLDNVPCVIVGNKSDLNIQRQVSQEEGKEMAEQWNSPTVETSAKHNENVAKIFDMLIAEIEKANNPPSEEKGGCIVS